MALANLRLAFGAEMSERQLRALNRKHFRLLGANFLAGLKASTMPSEKIWERVTANVPEERPRIGWLALISHLSCWELFSHLAERIPEYRFGAVYRRLYNPYLDRYLRKTRAKSGTTLFDRYEDLFAKMAGLPLPARTQSSAPKAASAIAETARSASA